MMVFGGINLSILVLYPAAE